MQILNTSCYAEYGADTEDTHPFKLSGGAINFSQPQQAAPPPDSNSSNATAAGAADDSAGSDAQDVWSAVQQGCSVDANISCICGLVVGCGNNFLRW